MLDENGTGAPTDLNAARNALRAELIARGHDVASDTLGTRRELYVMGSNDLARALFEFNTSAESAAESMYLGSGSWGPGMPPRFAVLPATESDAPSVEMLEQMRAVPLLFDVNGGEVTFRDLDRLLAEHLGD